MKRKMIAAAMAAAIALSLAGCSNTDTAGNSATSGAAATSASAAASASGSSGGHTDDGILNIAILADLTSMDPMLTNDYSGELVINNLYDTLLKFDTATSELSDNLASYEQKDDTTYVFTLRDDVKFWDGNALTPDDVVFSMERNMNPDNASLFGYMYANVESVEATGDHEVTVHMANVDNDFPYAMATMAGGIVEKAFVEEQGDAYGTAHGSVMGTGPYKFDNWTEGSQIVFTKNDDYWQDVTYPEDTLEFDIIADEATIAMSLKSGAVDFYNNESKDVIDQIADSSNVTTTYSDGMQNAYVMFNCSYGPFADVNLRKAAACAIDAVSLEAGTREAGYYKDAKALDYDPTSIDFYQDDWVALNDELDSYSYDLDKAKEYLAASDYQEGTVLKMPVIPLTQKESEAVQYYLQQIGVTVELETVPTADFFNYCYGVTRNEDGERDYDLLVFAWFPDYADPTSYLMLYYSENAGVGGSNQANYKNEEFDKLYLEAKTETGDTRNETLMKAYRLLNADCPAKFLSYFGPTAAFNTAYTCTLPAMWMWNFNFTQVSKA